MESRSQQHKQKGNKGLVFAVIVLVTIVVFLVLFILNTLGKKNETTTSQTTSSSIAETAISSSTTASSAALTAQTSSKTEETTESSIDNYKFAVDFSSFKEGTMFFAKDSQISFTLEISEPTRLELTGAVFVDGSTEGAHPYKMRVSLVTEQHPEITIPMEDIRTIKDVKVNTMLRNATKYMQEGDEIVEMHDLFKMMHAEEEPIYAYYKKSGNIALAFKSTEDNNYFYLEFQKSN